ncbi:MAG: VOC family protein [Kineosporiaceae bacterium]
MTSIDVLTLDTADPDAAVGFYSRAFGGRLASAITPASGQVGGYRGFTLGLTVTGPSAVDALLASAVDAGATVIKPAAKSLWGYGGVVQAPDGVICKVASSKKKDPAVDAAPEATVVLLLGVDDVAASKAFYVSRGLTVARSFGRKYVEFATSGVTVGLYQRKALAKDAGVPADAGVPGLTITADAGTFTDPDGFAWESAA